jgi:hypothetical protein
VKLPDEPADHPAGGASGRSGRVAKLPDGAVAQPLLDAHAASKQPPVRSKSNALVEISAFLTAGDPRSRQEIVDRKLAELIEQQHRIEVAREALAHGQRCPAGDPMRCSRFWSIIDGQLRGLSLEESHERVH